MLFGLGFSDCLFVLNTEANLPASHTYNTVFIVQEPSKKEKKPFCLSLLYSTSSIDLML